MANKGEKSIIIAEMYEKNFRLEYLNGKYYVTLPKFAEMIKKARGKKIVPYFELKAWQEVVKKMESKAIEHSRELRDQVNP